MFLSFLQNLNCRFANNISLVRMDERLLEKSNFLSTFYSAFALLIQISFDARDIISIMRTWLSSLWFKWSWRSFIVMSHVTLWVSEYFELYLKDEYFRVQNTHSDGLLSHLLAKVITSKKGLVKFFAKRETCKSWAGNVSLFLQNWSRMIPGGHTVDPAVSTVCWWWFFIVHQHFNWSFSVCLKKTNIWTHICENRLFWTHKRVGCLISSFQPENYDDFHEIFWFLWIFECKTLVRMASRAI